MFLKIKQWQYKIGDAAQYAKNQLNNLLLKELEQEIVLKPAMKRMLDYSKYVKSSLNNKERLNQSREVLKNKFNLTDEQIKDYEKVKDISGILLNSEIDPNFRKAISKYHGLYYMDIYYDNIIKGQHSKNEKANEKDNKVFEEIKRTQNIKEIEEINPIVEKVNKNNNLLSKEAKESSKKIKTYWESFKEKLENEFIEYEKALGSLDTKSFNNNKQAITKYINSLYESKKKINEFLFEKEVIKEDEF